MFSICIVQFCELLPVRNTQTPERGVSDLYARLFVDPVVVDITNELWCRGASVGKALLANPCAYYDDTTWLFFTWKLILPVLRYQWNTVSRICYVTSSCIIASLTYPLSLSLSRLITSRLETSIFRVISRHYGNVKASNRLLSPKVCGKILSYLFFNSWFRSIIILLEWGILIL